MCLTLCDPMDWGPPASFVRGILLANILEWAAISFSRGSSWALPSPGFDLGSPELQADSLLPELPGKCIYLHISNQLNTPLLCFVIFEHYCWLPPVVIVSLMPPFSASLTMYSDIKFFCYIHNCSFYSVIIWKKLPTKPSSIPCLHFCSWTTLCFSAKNHVFPALRIT